MSADATSAATVEDVSAVRKRLQVEVPAVEVQRELDRAYDVVRRTARLHGFRPGKAPRRVLENIYGNQVQHEVMARLVEASFHQAVHDHALTVVGSPEIDADDLERGGPFRYTATVDVRPLIEIADLTRIEATRPMPVVADEDVERSVGRLRDSAAELRPIDDRGTVEAGDVVTVDIASRLADREPEERTDVMLDAGAGSFPQAIERQLVGQHVGARLSLEVPYPEDYGNHGLAGKTVHFDVSIKALHAKELPPLDDDFARDTGHAENLDELRANIRADLESQAKGHAESELREAVITALVAQHTFEVPESLVTRRCDTMLASLGLRLPEGTNPEETLAPLREQARPRAEQDVRADLVLDAIVAGKGLEATDADVDAEIEAIVAKEKEPERVRAFYGQPEARTALQTRLGRARAFDYVLTQAKITDAVGTDEVAQA